MPAEVETRGTYWLNLTKREYSILSVTDYLLGRIGQTDSLEETIYPLDEALIDTYFLFRFDPVWCEHVNKIQKLMRKLPSLADSESLSPQERLHWWRHLTLNVGLRCEGSDERPIVRTDRDYYHSFDPSLRRLVHKQQRAENQQLQQRWAEEVNLTREVQSALFWLAYEYNLVPQYHEESEWSDKQEQQQLKYVAGWVLFERGFLPLFRWRATKLEEQKTGRGIERTIRPRHWRTQHDGQLHQGRGGRMSHEVRVRTWTIYYLSRRGGGHRTEKGAVSVWQMVYYDLNSPQPSVHFHNYQKERDRLFCGGTVKKQ